MPHRKTHIALVALALTAILSAGANAQRAASIQASARVFGSVVPETQLATETHLTRLTQTVQTEEIGTSQPVRTKKGIAHLYTELLGPKQSQNSSEAEAAHQLAGQVDRSHVRLTVAYTAN